MEYLHGFSILHQDYGKRVALHGGYLSNYQGQSLLVIESMTECNSLYQSLLVDDIRVRSDRSSNSSDDDDDDIESSTSKLWYKLLHSVIDSITNNDWPW